jgi:hypothetical protein
VVAEYIVAAYILGRNERVSNLTLELTRAEHEAFKMREQFNDETNAIEASG